MGSMVKLNITKLDLWQEVKNYNETFAPISKCVSIRCILTIATIEDMEIHQMDVKITFLNGDLEKEIYME